MQPRWPCLQISVQVALKPAPKPRFHWLSYFKLGACLRQPLGCGGRAALELAVHLALLPYPLQGADTASSSDSGWGAAAFQLCGRVTILQLRRMWRACIKPLQTWRDFAVLCPEPTLPPPRWAGTTGTCCRWWCCSAGRDFQLLPKGNASCCSLCINSDIADTWISKKTSEMYFRSFTGGSFSSCSWHRWDSHLCSLFFFSKKKREWSAAETPCVLPPPCRAWGRKPCEGQHRVSHVHMEQSSLGQGLHWCFSALELPRH